MGLVYATITLINIDDKALFRRGYLKKEHIRQMEVTAMVDSGAVMLTINENIKHQLGLETIRVQTAQLANGSLVDLEVVGPVEVLFENRGATCSAFVIPGDNEVLLGAIPMEEMDVLIHPKDNKLIVNPSHPHKAVVKLK
jgi:clan AA aspartic protease